MARKHLTQKGYDLVTTVVLILVGILWLANANPVWQIINCGLFVAAAGWWISKSSFATKMMNYLMGEMEE